MLGNQTHLVVEVVPREGEEEETKKLTAHTCIIEPPFPRNKTQLTVPLKSPLSPRSFTVSVMVASTGLSLRSLLTRARLARQAFLGRCPGAGTSPIGRDRYLVQHAFINTQGASQHLAIMLSFDRIGHIVDQGQHRELLHNSLYRVMVEKQQSDA